MKSRLSRLSHLLCAATLAVGMTQAEELNLKETPETTTVSLTPLSYGVEIGGLFALNEDLRNENETFLELGLATSILFADHFAMGINYDWLLPGGSQGGALSLDYVFGKGPFRPFVGAGLGLHYIDNGQKFGDAFGVSGTGHAGMLFDVLDQLQLRVRAPFYFVGNKNADQLAGIDFALLFSGPHRNTRVKKLSY